MSARGPEARRSLRLRVGGLVLAVEADRPTLALAPTPALASFLASRGADIRLRLVEEPPPRPDPADLVFESGGTWTVHRVGGRLLYSVRTRGPRPGVRKAALVDEGLRDGRLFLPPSPGERRHALEYPLDELLFQHRLALEGGVEIHACGVVWRDIALLFCGRSGAGKSTIARLWRRHAPGASLLSDDRIVLRPGSRGVRAFGTPWHGDGGFASPESRPLGVLLFLRHGKRTRVTPLSRAEAAARLFARSFPPPWDIAGVEGALRACVEAAAAVPAYDLAFHPDRSAVEAARSLAQDLRP